MEIGVLLQSFLMIFLAEMGDKSQFLMAAMTAQYRVRDILLGASAAILVLNLLAVVLGEALGAILPTRLVSIASALVFLFFARAALLADGEEEKGQTGRKKHASVAVFGAYFLAELGDKTQLSAMALAAEERGGALAVLCGATLGLFLSGVIGLLVGAVLGKRLPQALFSRVSAVLFFVCGTVRLLGGMEDCFRKSRHPTLYALIPTVFMTVAFILWSAWGLKKSKERNRYGKANASGYQSVSQQ